jgi:hypothetical protein
MLIGFPFHWESHEFIVYQRFCAFDHSEMHAAMGYFVGLFGPSEPPPIGVKPPFAKV